MNSYDKDSKKAKTLIAFAATTKSKDKTSLKYTGPVNLKNLIEKQFKEKSFCAANGEAILFRDNSDTEYKNILLIGLGDAKGISLESVRSTSANAYKKLAAEKLCSASILFDSLSGFLKSESDTAQAMTEGLSLAAYKYDDNLSKEKKKEIKS